MDDNQTFSCRIDNVKSITDVLTCLSGDVSKDLPCYIEVTAEGMIIIMSSLNVMYLFNSYIVYCNWQRKSYSSSFKFASRSL